ncbi:MAG TPA: glycosyltransferase family 4 protein [Actinomycetota bacterium]|nr:glycosyltransferase family 4 protein [Actinomycetota bacterium]
MELNAIDLAGGLRERGHDVRLFADREDDRPLVGVASSRGVDIELLDPAGPHIGRFVRGLNRLIRRFEPDLVHTYGRWPTWGAFLGPHLMKGVPLLSTCYSMTVPPWGPRTPHLIVGTEEIADSTRSWYRGPLHVLEPPVDLESNQANAIDASEFIYSHGLDASHRRIVIVSRLVHDMKLDGIALAIDAVELLGQPDLDLVIVGTGDAEDVVRRKAEAANRRLGRPAVVLVGPMNDPRPAYAAADLVLGQGGSAIRAMSFAKPLIVIGEKGFSLPFLESTSEVFFRQGLWGMGSGGMHPEILAAQIQTLLDDADTRQRAGAFGRRTALSRYGLQQAAARLEDIYLHVLSHPPKRGSELLDGGQAFATLWAARALSARTRKGA